MELFFLTVIGILAVGIFAPFAFFWWIRSGPIERQADHAEATWRQQMRDAGHTPDEIELHSQIRLALAGIQDKASEAIYRNDGNIDEQINEIAMTYIMAAGERSFNGRALHNVLKETPKEELLYPDALEELERQYRAKERERPEGWRPVRNVPSSPKSADQRAHEAWLALNAYTTRH